MLPTGDGAGFSPRTYAADDRYYVIQPLLCPADQRSDSYNRSVVSELRRFTVPLSDMHFDHAGTVG